jgi:hypothetical protein
MQFSKYLLAFVLSIALAEATEYSSPSTGKETSKRMVSKASTVNHSTLKHEDYEHGYEDEGYGKTKTAHGNTTTFIAKNLTKEVIE